jgi:hypothetical protein
MIPAIPRARNLAVFSLLFCLNTFAAAVFAFAAPAAFEEMFAIMND